MFNVLNMRLREQPYRKDPPADLNTRARIRDAAIVVFGEEGFGVGVRAIAKAAGVSPGLVNHHFGSKDGLRAACDEHVRSLIRTAKTEYVLEPSPTATLQALTEIEEYAPLIAYLMRTFQTGGALLVTWFEQMVADVEAYLAIGIEAGTLRSPTDLKATARYLATQSGGGFFFFLQLHEASHDGELDYRKALREFADQMMLPAVEMSTHGLFTDSTVLDALLAER
ncbi:TetR family transcriptional regulator [Nocardia sp. CA-084685]|uniref:TetR/AcrR family transcriptional regulator n=1 Tax=Nocardia sp. CA-084685 TaxID=3239970 RepID=UPI003D997B39